MIPKCSCAPHPHHGYPSSPRFPQEQIDKHFNPFPFIPGYGG